MLLLTIICPYGRASFTNIAIYLTIKDLMGLVWVLLNLQVKRGLTFTKRLVEEAGVLLLPSSIYRPECGPSPQNYFRYGYGRTQLEDGLAVMDDYLSHTPRLKELHAHWQLHKFQTMFVYLYRISTHLKSQRYGQDYWFP